jgi:hypothetical protein
MKNASMLLLALLAVLLAATWTSQASAAGRDEAISRCIAQAKKQYRGTAARGPGNIVHFHTWPACILQASLRSERRQRAAAAHPFAHTSRLPSSER